MMQADRGKGENSATSGAHASNLEQIADAAGAATKPRGPAPVHLWDPPFSGDLDMRIARDGSWHYQGSRINREPLVRLFGRILRKDEDGETYLITPVEKFRIKVEDTPFIGVDINFHGEGAEQRVEIETNHAERVTLGPDHPLRLVLNAETGEQTPYIVVRDRLEARLDRKSFFRLVDAATEEPADERTGRRKEWGVWSSGTFFPLQDGPEPEL